MICPNCQKEIADGSLACPACGVSFTAPVQPPAAVMPQAQPAPVKAKKPVYKKWWFWVLIVVIAIIAIGSLGGSDESETKAPTVSADIGDTKAAAATQKQTESRAATTAEDTSVVLYSKNDIVITYKSRDEDIFGKKFNILVENNSSKNIIVRMDDAAVDGYTVSAYLYTEVSAGKKANDSFSIYDSELSKNGIDEIKSLEIKLSIMNSDTYGDIDTSDTITLNF